MGGIPPAYIRIRFTSITAPAHLYTKRHTRSGFSLLEATLLYSVWRLLYAEQDLEYSNLPDKPSYPKHYNTKQPHTIHDQKQHKQSNLYSISMFMDIIYYLRYAIRCLTWCGHKILKKDFAIWCIMRNWFFMYLIFFIIIAIIYLC